MSRKKKSKEASPGVAGNPSQHIQRWRRSLHWFYIKLLKETLGKVLDGATILEENKHLRVPAPPTYNGAADVEKFDDHIINMTRWLQLNGMGGKSNDQRRIVTHGFYLSGAARHCVQKATDNCFTARYSPEIGIMGLYYELMTASRRMVKRPDSYTFKTNLVSRMPAAMVQGLLLKDVNAEYSTIHQIVNAAAAWEWSRTMEGRYKDQAKVRAHMAAGAGGVPKQGNKEHFGRMVDDNGRMFRVTSDSEANARFAPVGSQWGSAAAAEDTVCEWQRGERQAAQPGTRPPVACYNCGGPHYKDQCTQRKPREPNMFAGREVIQKKDEEVAPGSKDEEAGENAPGAGPAATEQFGHMNDNDEVELDSDFTLEECSEYSFYEDDDRCGAMREIVVEYDEEGLPALQEVSDSDYDSESDSEEGMAYYDFDEESPTCMVGEYSETTSEYDLYDLDRFDADSVFAEEDEWEAPGPLPKPSKACRRMPTMREIGLYGVCDDYSDDEFITEDEVDTLAREMADKLKAQWDPNEVLEYFAAGNDASTEAGSRASKKRPVYLKRSKQVRPRPARTKPENFCLTGYVKVNGMGAFALFDSGCTTEACSPDFARVAGLKVFPIHSEITLQLGTAGSRSKINHGVTAMCEYDDIKSEEYLDIVNLD
ncbi:hypothetical protein K438DRAFT_1998848 [Mycena galopus ATCC 62051]|nr:hypothetical protein K438DRAFT_1998848 [Mycena galopus ATCC 62051]